MFYILHKGCVKLFYNNTVQGKNKNQNTKDGTSIKQNNE